MTSNKKSGSNAMLNPTDSTVNIANTTYVVQDIEETFKKIANNTTDNNYTEVTTQDQNNLKLNSNGNNNTEQKKNKNTEKQRKTTENKNINENRNKKKMNRWGNTNKYAGDKLNENDGTTLRILYNNCNSLEINNLIHEKMKFKFEKKKRKFIGQMRQNSKTEIILDNAKKIQANIICLAETCVAWELPATRNIFKSISRQFDPTMCWTTSSSKVPTGSYYKPGGTATITEGGWSGRISERGADPSGMGRWSYITILGKNNQKLTIVTGYRNSKRDLNNVGSTTAVAQQAMLLEKQGRKRIGTEAAFLKDLEKWIQKKIVEEGQQILIAMDANEVWLGNSSIKEFAERNGLNNLASATRHKLPSSKPSTNRTIDFLLGTDEVLNNTKAYGMIPYNLSLGDHRGQYIDLDIKGLLGLNKIDRNNQANRRLKTNDIKSTKKYLKQLKKSIKKHNIAERMKKLLMKIDQKCPKQEIQQMYNKIDSDMFRLCKNAENKCKKLSNKNTPWSLKNMETIHKMYFLQKIARRNSNNQSATEADKKEALEMGLTINIENKIEVDETLKQIKKETKLSESKAKEYRIEFLQSQAKKYAADNHLPEAKAIEELICHEEIRDTYSTISSKMSERHKGQLGKLWVPNQNGNEMDKTEIDEGDTLHEVILSRNETHLRQARNTPFAETNLGKKMKWDGTGKIVDTILDGDWTNDEGYHEWIELYIKGLATDNLETLNSIDTEITEEEYKKFWKRKRETTATSPFGLHIGHYKAGITVDIICEIQRHLMLIPFQIGFTPNRWKKTVQLMLEKDKGRPWIHRLRIIELFDSQLNAALQILIGRKMVYHALDKGLIHNSAYGSVPGKTAHGAILHKLLIIEAFRLNKFNGALFECDATGCYDRILQALQAIHVRRLGIKKEAAKVITGTLLKSKRYISTKFGISKTYIQSTKEKILYGIGQGSGCGPAMWLAHLTVMLTVFATLCKGVKLQSPDGKTTHKSNGTGYVDDCNILVVDKSKDTTQKKVETEMQHDAQWWERLLHTNGGKLELSKCFWYLFFWTWVGGVSKLSVKRKTNVRLDIKQTETNETITIEQKDIDDPVKVLGVHTSINGKWKTEATRWIGLSNKFASKVKKARFDRVCGNKLYSTLWLPKFRYVAGISNFTKKQCHTIQIPVINACLSSAGYNMKFPRQIVHGPLKYGGIGWESMRTAQILETTNLYLKHVKLDDEVGRLIKINQQTAQLIAGTGTSILDTTVPIEYVPPCWIMGLHDMLIEHKMSIVNWNEWIPQIQREDDQILMDTFIQHCPKKDLESINQCRIYLQAITVADLTNEEGTQITKEAWNVRMGKNFKKSRIKWPNQNRPGRAAIVMWKSALKNLGHINRILDAPLRKWVRTPYKKYNFELGKDGNIYKNIKGNYSRHNKISIFNRKYFRLGTACDMPTDTKPVQCIDSSFGITVMNDIEVTPNIQTESILQSIKNAPKYKRQIIGQIKSSIGLMKLKEEWNEKPDIIAATDGGLKDELGSHGYKIVFAGETEAIIEGHGAEQTANGTMTSTREELIGILAIYYIIQTCIEVWGKPKNGLDIQIVTDSEAAKTIRERNIEKLKPTIIMGPEMDIEMEIRRVVALLNITKSTITWTKSHVNKHDNVEDPYLTQLNSDADNLATEARDKAINHTMEPHIHDLLPGTITSAKIGNHLIHNNRKIRVKDHCHDEEMRKYLIRKHGWNDNIFHSVDWEAVNRSMKRYKPTTRVGIAKMIHKWQHTNVKKKKFTINPVKRKEVSDKCKRCGEIEEAMHGFKCKSIEMKALRKKGWKMIKTKMRPSTSEKVLEKIWYGLFSMEEGHEPECGPIYTEEEKALSQCFDQQTKIGWANFCLGRVSKQWGRINYENTKYRKNKIDPTSWTAKLIQELWRYSQGLWTGRNEKEHGQTLAISIDEREHVLNRIRTIYRIVRPLVLEEDKWLFRSTEIKKCKESYAKQIGWIAQVENKYLQVLIENECEDTRTYAHSNYCLERARNRHKSI